MAKDFQILPPNTINPDIPIFQKIYDFYKELYQSLLKFPKVHRYTLGQKLDDTTLELFEFLVLASKRQLEKSTLLHKANAKLETLKLLLRLAKDTKSIDNNKYLALESSLQEIGKMLGGWMKHVEQTT